MVFVISDLHLSETSDKPMNVFGNLWCDHIQKLERNWKNLVTETDTVVIPGDISWGANSGDAVEDFRFINSLPGKKIIGKGNHDFWWATMSKMESFLSQHGFDTIEILHNNAYERENMIICGTRGWKTDALASSEQDKRISLREGARLEASLKCGLNLHEKSGKEIVVFLHYPPFYKNSACSPVAKLLVLNGISRCYYGHIHYSDAPNAHSMPLNISSYCLKYGKTSLIPVSCDYLNFTPLSI